MIDAKIVLDSINPDGNRITTWLLTYPRFIHSEFLTHRVFSRNSASSRAIPIEKQMEAIADNPAEFEWWGKNQKGMQAEVEMDAEHKEYAKNTWYIALENALQSADNMLNIGAHKQTANRILEPFAHMTTLATAVDHRNFFKLRAHPAAQPEFQVLAYRMLDKYLASTPNPLPWGEWHLPGFDEDAGELIPIKERLEITTALACRASYSAFEEGISPEDAKRIHDRGVAMGHWSPFEHSAQAIDNDNPGVFEYYPYSNFDNPSCEGGMGMSGWGQYRKTFRKVEAGYNCDLKQIMEAKPAWVLVN